MKTTNSSHKSKLLDSEKYIHELISQGEHQCLDFKFEISDARKIAKSIAAFANTDGGKLLIGVKDNGQIAGIRTEEELYMVESATKLYVKPSVPVLYSQHFIEKKRVLEIDIKPSKIKPHAALCGHDKWLVYVRVHDQNLLANRTLLKFWEQESKQKQVKISFQEPQQYLMQYLQAHEHIQLKQFAKNTNISIYRAEQILIDFMLLKIIQMEITERGVWYKLHHSQNIDFSNEKGVVSRQPPTQKK